MPEIEVADADAFRRDVLEAPGPTVVVFWAAWCPFCRSFRRLFDETAARSAGRFAVVRLDDEESPLWDEYRVNVVPSLAYFRDGGLIARRDGRLGRGLAADELSAFLEI